MLSRNFTHFYTSINKFIRNMSAKACKVAVCQFTATNNKANNLISVQKLISAAKEKEAEVVFLPEGCDYVATTKEESKELAEPLEGNLIKQYKNLAQKYKIWVSIGGFHELNSQGTLSNCHILISDLGEIKSIYRKVHLFDVEIPEKNLNLKESTYVESGKEIVQPVETPAGRVGLSICYDMRFPELSTILRKMGATILTFPSAFTNDTGKAHWEVLLRARAVENQCYVIAAAQYGHHNDKRVSFGQAMIVDPWGTILAECIKYTPNTKMNESLAIATIDPNVIIKIRREMPVFEHRRNDLYELVSSPTKAPSNEEKPHYKFANNVISLSTIFYLSQLSFAFTNIRCVVPGHVLVSPIRPARRLQDLTPAEVSDFFQTVIKVQKAVEKTYGAESSCVCIQDGKDAGQTVPHVHCHVLPRKPDDFERSDDIYTELAKHDRDENQTRRCDEEMTQEANILRQNFI